MQRWRRRGDDDERAVAERWAAGAGAHPRVVCGVGVVLR